MDDVIDLTKLFVDPPNHDGVIRMQFPHTERWREVIATYYDEAKQDVYAWHDRNNPPVNIFVELYPKGWFKKRHKSL